MKKTINFQLTPYSEEVKDFIWNLNKNEIYEIFSQNFNSEVMTAALFRIDKIEYEKFKEEGKGKEKNFFELCFIGDSFMTLENFYELTIFPQISLFIKDNQYCGHVYSWISEEKTYCIINLTNFRCSIEKSLDFFIKEEIVSNLISEIYRGRKKYVDYLRIIQQQPDLYNEFIKCGFVRLGNLKHENKEYINWLMKTDSLKSTWMSRFLLFRNKDFILNVKDGLKCLKSSF